MARNNKLHRAKVNKGRGEVLFAQVFHSPRFFYTACDSGPVVCRDVKLFDGVVCLLVSNSKLAELFGKVRKQEALRMEGFCRFKQLG